MKVKCTEKLNNEPIHSILADIKEHLGLIAVAEAGHGKSYAVASMVQEALKDESLTVIVLSPSSIWRRKLWSGKYVLVGTYEFNPIQETKQTEIQSIPFLRDAVHINLDKKWSYIKNNWLESLLQSKESLLFEIKYRNGRRIKAFESLVIQYIYEQQEKAIEANPNYNHHYLIVLEEIQKNEPSKRFNLENSFGTYSMNTDDSLDLMTIFSQSRSDALIHYIGIGQRLNDISTKVIERLRPFIGLTLGENSLRKIKSQLPEHLKDRVQQLPKRHWIYLNGKDNPEIEIPEFIRHGAPKQLKPPVRQPTKHIETKEKKPLLLRYLLFLNKFNPYGGSVEEPTKDDTSEFDGALGIDTDNNFDNVLFPPEPQVS